MLLKLFRNHFIKVGNNLSKKKRKLKERKKQRKEGRMAARNEGRKEMITIQLLNKDKRNDIKIR